MLHSARSQAFKYYRRVDKQYLSYKDTLAYYSKVQNCKKKSFTVFTSFTLSLIRPCKTLMRQFTGAFFPLILTGDLSP
jgi:hypothetical protein